MPQLHIMTSPNT